MAKRSRKRKLEGEDEAEVKWELTNILSEELRDEMSTMWEIPQIFHFLHMSKEALNISHLSMYEMERMLAMPRASKQLAHIMTCLLSAPLPKAKMRRVPPMPYEFWVNILTHKVKGWFKVYNSKHRDIIKILETIGVEPEFWRIIPDSSIIDEKNFDQLNFKQRVWILKTLCDTLMHSRKTIQDEMSKQYGEDQFETILGTDRYGAKYFYFPLFLDNDLRVYRHCIDNKILSTVKPQHWKEGQPSVPRPDKHGRNKRKRSRWKNGSLPVRDRRRSKKLLEEEAKLNSDNAIGSLISEDTNISGISAYSNNNNNIVIETIDRNSSRGSLKTPEESGVSAETHCSNPKSSGYDTNTSSDAKSLNGVETDELFRGFGPELDNDNSMNVISTIRDILNGITSKVSELVKSEESPNVRTATELENCLKIKDTEEEEGNSSVIDKKIFESDCEASRTDSGSDDLNWSKPRKSKSLDKEALQKGIAIFSGMLGDLSVSSFELVADSVQSLRDLAISLLTNELNETRGRNSYAPRCEIALARSMEELIESLKNVEPALKESARKARIKLQREWTNFKDGVVEDQDASGDVDQGSNGWIIGSQGYPLLSSSDATLQTLSEFALSPPGSEIPARRSSSIESEIQDERTAVSHTAESTEDRMSNEKCKSQRRVRIEAKEEANEENVDADDSKEEPETRRVLRRRGISSYTEQLSSSEDESYELEEWPQFKTVDATPSTSDSTTVVNTAQKTGQIGGESEEKDSDQDWILPGARKRKNKRSPANRKLKPSPQKSQTNNSDSQDSTTNNPPPPLFVSTVQSTTKTSETAKESINKEVPLICKLESIHSVLDIKDEGPIFEYNRNIVNPSNVEQTQSPSQQYYAAPPQLSPSLQGPPAPAMPQIETNYYVQRPEHYLPPGTVPSYIQYSFPHVGRGTVRYPYPPALQPPRYPVSPGQQNYWQYQKYSQMPPRPYPTNILRPGCPTQRRASPQRHQVASTTLYGARSPSKPPMPRMPAPRSMAVQSPNFRAATRPRLPNPQSPGKRYGPRNSTVQPSGTRMPRPNRPNNNQETSASATKTTSLILLSDSDDEIEMIVSEKQSTPVKATNNWQTTAGNKSKPLVSATRPRPKPVVTSEITVPKSREVLSPQMIQRMSQGGISITPVKPPPSKQISGDTSQGTKLVVVVNETGSHYALALPNGSKLILTPEQLAQIRASNGGKLVL